MRSLFQFLIGVIINFDFSRGSTAMVRDCCVWPLLFPQMIIWLPGKTSPQNISYITSNFCKSVRSYDRDD